MGPSINGSLGRLSTLCSLSNLKALDSFPPGVEGNLILDPSDFSLSIVQVLTLVHAVEIWIWTLVGSLIECGWFRI